MLLHEVVPDRVERDHVHVVLEFLRERIGEPGEAAHVHPHRKVLPFGIGRADMLRVGIAFDPFLARANAFCGAVAALRAFGGAPYSFTSCA